MAKLGYTFYPKDWGNSESVFELNLAERGLYRELIDMAMLNDNKTEIKLEVWSRKFAVSIDELNQILEKLLSLKLIEINEKSLFVPSCENRLNLSRAGKKSKPTEASKNNLSQGKKEPSPKPMSEPFSKPHSEQREREREREREIEDEIKKENNNDDDFLNFKILILKKISENKIDFKSEISICQEKCNNAKNRDEEMFHENCIKFLTIEKNKKKPPDKENNTAFSQLLKKDDDWIEDMAKAFKKPPNFFFVKLDEFVMHLNTDKKFHPTENEFRKHFKSWLPYNLEIKSTTETSSAGFAKNR